MDLAEVTSRGGSHFPRLVFRFGHTIAATMEPPEDSRKKAAMERGHAGFRNSAHPRDPGGGGVLQRP